MTKVYTKIKYLLFKFAYLLSNAGFINSKKRKQTQSLDNSFLKYNDKCCNRYVIEVDDINYGIKKCNTCGINDMKDGDYCTKNCKIRDIAMNYHHIDNDYVEENEDKILSEIKNNYGIKHININNKL